MFSRRLFLKAATACVALGPGVLTGSTIKIYSGKSPSSPNDPADGELLMSWEVRDRPAGTLAIYSDTGTLLSRIEMSFDGSRWHGRDPAIAASGKAARIAWDFPNGDRFEGTAGVHGSGADLEFNSCYWIQGCSGIDMNFRLPPIDVEPGRPTALGRLLMGEAATPG